MPSRQPPKLSLKQERMSDRIREILSSVLLIDVTDPALSGVTVLLFERARLAEAFNKKCAAESAETAALEQAAALEKSKTAP